MKRFTALSLSLFLVLSLFISPAFAQNTNIGTTQTQEGSGFTDVGPEYERAIRYLKNKGIISGYNETEFRPDATITRAEFIKMLIESQESSSEESPIYLSSTEEVTPAPWYEEYMQRAWQLSLIGEEAVNHPHDPLRRIQGAQLALNMMGIPIPRINTNRQWPFSYDDVNEDSRIAPAVMLATQYGLLGPDNEEGTLFRPFKTLTRGEAAQIIYNMDIYLLGLSFMETNPELQGAQDIPHLETFVNVWQKIQTDYNDANSDKPEAEAIIYGSIKGMVNTLGDPYSSFLDPQESATLNEQLGGNFAGVGINIEQFPDGSTIIISVFENSPAERAGLLANDRIIKVDGIDIRTMSLTEIVQLIRGEIKTPVTLSVMRGDENVPRDLTAIRDSLTIPVVDVEMKGDIVYADINLFTNNTFREFSQDVTALVEENPNFKGFVIDLRGNPGGYLSAAGSVIGHFVPKNSMILLLKTNNGYTPYYSDGRGEWDNYPITILIDEGSASAAEIVALILRERADAILVGNQSFGKGTVQQLIEYNDGSQLKLTYAEWKSPGFHSINNIGIAPEIFVEMTEENRIQGEDPQLDEALEELDLMISDWDYSFLQTQ